MVAVTDPAHRSSSNSCPSSSSQPGSCSRRRFQSVQGPSQNPLQSTAETRRLQVPHFLRVCAQGVQLWRHALHQQGDGRSICSCSCSFYIVFWIGVCNQSLQEQTQAPLQSTAEARRLQVPHFLRVCAQGVQLRRHALHRKGDGIKDGRG
jgi:hypothetical protein